MINTLLIPPPPPRPPECHVLFEWPQSKIDRMEQQFEG